MSGIKTAVLLFAAALFIGPCAAQMAPVFIDTEQFNQDISGGAPAGCIQYMSSQESHCSPGICLADCYSAGTD
jgi:hypothetical protein